LNIVTKEDLREFLRNVKPKYALETYSGFIKTIRVFFRDYLGRPELATFKFPSKPFIPKILHFDKKDLQRFYDNIEHSIVSMMFLGYCVTGLRRNDIMSLMKTELHRDLRMIVKNNGSRTKHRWITFYNEELADLLHDYLDSREDDNPKVFPISRCRTFQKEWRIAKEKTGLDITPKDLRDWFCMEMTELNVSDRYIDAFCGRIPKTILGRHYTDYSPKKLKEIYDKANLKLLS
jgi:integrase